MAASSNTLLNSYRGFCEVAFVVGTDEATLGKVVHSIDEKLWPACNEGIAIALKVGVENT
jgi:hypothetical protein